MLEDTISYLADDPRQLVETVVDELHLLQRHWRGQGLPLLVIPIGAEAFQLHPETFITLGRTLLSGLIEGIPVQFNRLSHLADQGRWHTLPASGIKRLADQTPPASKAPRLRDATDLADLTAAQEQELDDTPVDQLHQRLWASSSLHEQAEVLELLQRRLGSQAVETGPDGRPVDLQVLLDEVYHHGLRCQDWSVVRRCAGAMGMVHPQLEDALTDLLVRQKQVVVGRNYTADSRLITPQSSASIATLIDRTSGKDARERMLEQELLLALDAIARREPGLLKGSLTLQLGQLLLLLTSELAVERNLNTKPLKPCSEPPCDPYAASRRTHRYGPRQSRLARGEQLHLVDELMERPAGERQGDDWLQHRIGWEPCNECRVTMPESGRCLTLPRPGDRRQVERRNRLNSALVLETTAGERNFASQVEHLLSRIEAPEYRQLCCECLLSLMAFIETNPDVQMDDDLALDVVIGHAVRVGWQQSHPNLDPGTYSQHKTSAWNRFYAASPADCRRWQIAALRQLAEQEGLVRSGL